MAEPRIRDVAKLKRIARYLKGKARMITALHAQDVPKEVVIWVASNWAGRCDTRQSTSGGLVCGDPML